MLYKYYFEHWGKGMQVQLRICVGLKDIMQGYGQDSRS